MQAAQLPARATSVTPLLEGRSLPLLVEGTRGLDAVSWALANRSSIETMLLSHAAVLFRGFELRSLQDFERFAASIEPALFGDYGDLPRKAISLRIWKSSGPKCFLSVRW